MEIEVKSRDEVWTTDEQRLGSARALFHRTKDINPALRLFATYLEVEDLDYGETFYVPTDFIVERQEDGGRITLSKKRDDAMQLTWFRMPDFVARGEYRKEELPE